MCQNGLSEVTITLRGSLCAPIGRVPRVIEHIDPSHVVLVLTLKSSVK